MSEKPIGYTDSSGTRWDIDVATWKEDKCTEIALDVCQLGLPAAIERGADRLERAQKGGGHG